MTHIKEVALISRKRYKSRLLQKSWDFSHSPGAQYSSDLINRCVHALHHHNVKYHHVQVHGHHGKAVCEIVKAESVDLVVLGIDPGRPRVSHNSTVRYVLRRAVCPVSVCVKRKQPASKSYSPGDSSDIGVSHPREGPASADSDNVISDSSASTDADFITLHIDVDSTTADAA